MTEETFEIAESFNPDFRALLRACNHLGLPECWRTDLYFDQKTIETNDGGRGYGFILRECGTWALLPGGDMSAARSAKENKFKAVFVKFGQWREVKPEELEKLLK